MPLTFDGVKVTPWFVYGAMGRNALNGYRGYGAINAWDGDGWRTADGRPEATLLGVYPGIGVSDVFNGALAGFNIDPNFKRAYSNMFFVGLPV